jgi:trehalose 6-phosphate phosphatase
MLTRSAQPPLARPDWAFFLDVDGTLLDIAASPSEVRAGSEVIANLAALQHACNGALALLSGRRIADLDRIFWPLRLPAAGVHGLERRRCDGSIEIAEDDAVDALRPSLAAFAAREPGVVLEDKGVALALHYRSVPERGVAVRNFARSLDHASAGLRRIEGKMVVEFHSNRSDKGRAVDAFMAEAPFRGRRPSFAGDDVTDEDAFRAVARRGGVTLRIGASAASAASAARWHLPSVAALHAWLQQACVIPEMRRLPKDCPEQCVRRLR